MANEHSNITPNLQPTSKVADFKFWCQKVLPLVYDDSLSYYEVLNKMVIFLNQVIDNINADIDNVEEMEDAFSELQDYVNNFFDDIDQLVTYAERAEAAEVAALGSAANAATSASNAATSASNSAGSASSAATSALSAMDAKDAAVAAKAAAEAALANAQSAAVNASNSATAASGSATNAATSAASALQNFQLSDAARTAAQSAAASAESDAEDAAESAAEAVAAVDTVINGLGNITKTIENVPVATTEDALASIAKKLVIDIEPVQSGSGDPSPENVRPITGWTGANVYRTGVNIWDEEWEVGNIDNTTGQNVSATGRIRCKNYIPVVGGETYYFYCSSGKKLNVYAYTVEKQYIGVYLSTDEFSPNLNSFDIGNRAITVPDNCAFLKIKAIASYGETYLNDISINYPSSDTSYHAYNGTTYEITFPVEAGSVYGGTLTNTGNDEWKLKVETVFIELDGTETGWTKYGTGTILNGTLLVNTLDITAIKGYCSHVASTPGYPKQINTAILSHSNAYKGLEFKQVQSNFGVADNEVATWTAYLASQKANNTPIQIVAYLQTPIEYTITNEEAVILLNGINNVWADKGKINTLEYFTNAENYVTTQVDLAKALIAPVLKEMKADTALVANDFRIVGNTLYRITGNIASGGTLTPNTNCVATTVGAILKSLLSA